MGPLPVKAKSISFHQIDYDSILMAGGYNQPKVYVYTISSKGEQITQVCNFCTFIKVQYMC